LGSAISYSKFSLYELILFSPLYVVNRLYN
jgi:hypothetical protein